MRVSIGKKVLMETMFLYYGHIAERDRFLAARSISITGALTIVGGTTKMRFSLSCDPYVYANFAIKMCSRRKDGPLKSAATFVSLPIENAPSEGRRL